MNGCNENGLLPVATAIEHLLNAVTSAQRPQVITRSITEALNCVLAEPVVSKVNVPPLDNSAMDGFAFKHADLAPSGGRLPVSQRIPAGVAPPPLQAGTAARIFTGAPVPAGADTVVMQEQCTVEGDAVVLPEQAQAGGNIRSAGEDIAEGATILPAGHKLKAQDLGLIASVGVAEVAVFKPLKVALLCSGDELLEPGQPPEAGKIYNSNAYLLVPLLTQLGYVVNNQQGVADDYESTVTTLQQAAAQSDVVVTTGGVSVGEEDYIKDAVQQLGALDLWKINIKPGKPFAFGRIGTTPFIGLPGNPVSVFVTLLVLGLPYLRSLKGEAWQPAKPVSVPCGFSQKKPGKRDEYLRVRLAEAEDGSTRLEKYPHQGSGVLSSTSWADGLALVQAGECPREGEAIPYYSFAQLLQG